MAYDTNAIVREPLSMEGPLVSIHKGCVKHCGTCGALVGTTSLGQAIFAENEGDLAQKSQCHYEQLKQGSWEPQVLDPIFVYKAPLQAAQVRLTVFFVRRDQNSTEARQDRPLIAPRTSMSTSLTESKIMTRNANYPGATEAASWLSATRCMLRSTFLPMSLWVSFYCALQPLW